MEPGFEAAIFDFGGVLTTPIFASFSEFERSVGVPEGSLLEAFRHEAEDAEPAFHLLEKGLITEGEFYALMLARLSEVTGVVIEMPEDPAEVRRTLFAGLQVNHTMLDAAARIGAHHRTAVLSNNVREWTDWRDLIAAHAFDLIVDSSEEGVRKPEPEIYRLTCERLGVAPERAVFIDDIPQYVEGARTVGLHAIAFTTNDEVLAQLAALFPHAFAGNGEQIDA